MNTGIAAKGARHPFWAGISCGICLKPVELFLRGRVWLELIYVTGAETPLRELPVMTLKTFFFWEIANVLSYRLKNMNKTSRFKSNIRAYPKISHLWHCPTSCVTLTFPETPSQDWKCRPVEALVPCALLFTNPGYPTGDKALPLMQNNYR